MIDEDQLEKGRSVRWLPLLANALLIIVLAGLLIADSSDLMEFGRNPLAFHLGAEGVGFRYRTKTIFLTTAYVQLAVSVLGILAPQLYPSAKFGGWGRVLLRGVACVGLIGFIIVDLATVG